MNIDLFEKKSKSWDKKSRRVENAKNIAEFAISKIKLKPTMHLMDLGAGTGLLSFFFAPYVGKITAVDNSASMLEVFQKKTNEFECETNSIMIDYTKQDLDKKFDGIISSMTLHHIKDIKNLFKKLYNSLNNGGFIALADLEKEDGTFHSDNTGVYHFGFDTEEILEVAKEVGFKNISINTASNIKKPHNNFDIFLLIGYK